MSSLYTRCTQKLTTYYWPICLLRKIQFNSICVWRYRHNIFQAFTEICWYLGLSKEGNCKFNIHTFINIYVKKTVNDNFLTSNWFCRRCLTFYQTKITYENYDVYRSNTVGMIYRQTRNNFLNINKELNLKFQSWGAYENTFGLILLNSFVCGSGGNSKVHFPLSKHLHCYLFNCPCWS